MKVAHKYIKHKLAVLILGSPSPFKNKKRVDALTELLEVCPEIQKIVFTGGNDQARSMRRYFRAVFPTLSTPRRVFTEEFSDSLEEQIENTHPLFGQDTQIILLAGPLKIKQAAQAVAESGLTAYPLIVI